MQDIPPLNGPGNNGDESRSDHPGEGRGPSSMEGPAPNVNWHQWFERWEVMQNCYVPQRLYRFNLMLALPGFPSEKEIRILDLGCGPGSLSFFAFRRYPNARIVGADLDPVLLAMGRHVANATTDRITFLQVDLRDPSWWADYHAAFDLVLSATALHWLSTEGLEQTFRNVFDVLSPGGWFLNSDHAASDHPQTQERYREMLQARREAAFRATKADRWEDYWLALERELGPYSLSGIRNEVGFYEGSDDGQPKSLQLARLSQVGFEQAEVYWQDLGETIIAARKPLNTPSQALGRKE
jgi:SAM-dependent methyltransferase